MENILSNKLQFTSVISGYTRAYLSHTPVVDADYAGKSIWVNGARQDYPANDTLFYIVPNLTPATTYTVEGSFYDAMVDTSLRDARIGMSISDPISLTTAEPLVLESVGVETFQVDIGMVRPNLQFTFKGEAQLVFIEYKQSSSSTWTPLFTGGFSEVISFQAPVEGTLDFRARGVIPLGDGQTKDYSAWSSKTGIVVTKGLNPPAAATNITFTAAKISDTFEHIDIKVAWDWSKGSGGLVKSFSLEYVTQAEYLKTGWAKAKLLPTGTAQHAIITNFPYKVQHRFRVRSVAWGPEDINTTYSAAKLYIVNESTVFDSSFTLKTKMIMNYSGLYGYRDAGTAGYKQTFGLDAATGTVNIGEVGADGIAPITVDPLTGTLTVDGKVITESIYSANFILTDFGASSPALYSQGKTYGGSASGIWMGYTGGKYKFDIGNSAQYMRWDGTNLNISSNVRIGTPTGDLSLEDALTSNQNAYVYKNSASKPATPTGTAYPPSGWTKVPVDPPVGQVTWVSSGILNVSNSALDLGQSWSSPTQFSGEQGPKGDKGDKGNKGDTGPQGSSGAGIYAQPISSLSSFNGTQANSFFQTNFGRGPIKYDVITQYRSQDPTIAFTRMWNGSIWTTPSLVVHGDAIVDGTVRAQALVADDAFLATIGVNTIYDNAAAVSSNPEANYKMKISLNQGFIHIR